MSKADLERKLQDARREYRESTKMVSNSAENQAKPLSCPKCNSTNIQFLNQEKKGFSVSKAVGGGILTGGIGLLAGFAGKKGKYQWVCLDCSNRFQTK